MSNANLTPAVRAENFMRMTRQNFHTLPTQSFTAEGDRLNFVLPKARYLSTTYIEVEAVVKLTGSGEVKVNPFPFEMFNRISMEANSNFMPASLSGRDLNILSKLRMYPSVAAPLENKRAAMYVENQISAEGTNNNIHMIIPIQHVLSEKDAVGLILLQNDTTQVILSMDLDKVAKAYQLTEGQTAEFVSVKVTPFLQTFTIPLPEAARPDLSTLKMLSSKYEQFAADSQTVLKMPTQTIYRRIALYFEDETGKPMAPEDFRGTIDLVFNQADAPIMLKPAQLEYLNHHYYGEPLPAGVYVLDFACVPLPNIAGIRDLIDGERLTELWVRFSAKNAGKVTAISETISRLGQ